MAGMMEFGFGQGDESIGVKGNKLKLKEGEVYRLSFALWPDKKDDKGNVIQPVVPDLDAETPKFLGCKRFFLQGVGYFQDNGPEFAKIAGAPSKMAVATLVIKWPTDSKGSLNKARFQNGDFQVCSWIFSADKFRAIELNHREFPLGSADLMVSCIDTQYQKITTSPCRESMFRKLLEAGKADSLLQQIADAAVDLPRELAQDLTLDQLREKLGKGGGGPVGGRGGSSGGGRGATNVDFDDMLGDILK